MKKVAILSLHSNKFGKQSVVSYLLICILCAFTTLSLSGCASSSNPSVIDSGNAIYDPYEEYNRSITKFNLTIDHVAIYPAIRSYRTMTPDLAREGIQNVMRNLRSPVNLINQLLQGDLKGAGDVAVRALVNTTVGIGGLFDVAAYEGIPYESEDFGQTLAVWGVGNGPYIVVPFFGASTLRDYSGLVADSMMDPVNWYAYNTDRKGICYAKNGVDYLLLRDSLYDSMSEMERSSFDYYAALRSAYYQYRKAAILDSRNHRTSRTQYEELPEIPDFDDDY
ncbi:MAG: VacJ family lipoprotein [Alphaproteobacteria bacterium]|nr:VacJ family lipoprotein [Alphaproteobacteria bacterium]